MSRSDAFFSGRLALPAHSKELLAAERKPSAKAETAPSDHQRIPVVFSPDTTWTPAFVREPTPAANPRAHAQMALDAMAAGLQLTGQDTVTVTVAAVPASVVVQANPALAPAAGQIIHFGNARVVMIPDDPARADDMIVTLMSEPATTVVIRTYGGLEEAALNAFDARARQAGFQVQPRQPLTGTALGDILRQILANLSGLEESAVPELSVKELVEALTLRALA